MKPENADLLKCLGEAFVEAATSQEFKAVGMALLVKAGEQSVIAKTGPLTRPEPIKTAEAPDDAIPIRKGMGNARTTTGRVRPQRPKQQPATKAAKPD